MKQIVFFIAFFSLMDSFGQNLSKHQWKNRLLLVYTADKKSDLFKKQINQLESEIDGLKERKLIVYQFTSIEIRSDFKKPWQKSTEIYDEFITDDVPFQVFLIGLDGRTKLLQTSLLSTKALFSKIDQMPMRKRELKENN